VNAYEISLDGLGELPDLSEAPEKIARYARMAINRAAERARAQAARRMREQVAFPASYLTGQDARLYIKQKAVGDNLEAVITGRFRPTSLARFARENSASAARAKGGLTVEVKPGAAQFLRGAFFVKLRAGRERTDTKFNLGVAIRLKPGQRPRNTRAAAQLDHNVWLLYGPSVNQVFRTVREDIGPEVQDFLTAEFLRLLDVEGL